MSRFAPFLFVFASLILVTSCNKDENLDDGPKLIFKYTFDEDAARLDNFGNPASIPAGNSAQTPVFSELGIHSIELINYVASLPSSSTVIYQGEEVSVNGQTGIDFGKERIVKEGEVLVEIPIKDITPGTYTYLRNSLGYQNYKIDFVYNDPNLGSFDLEGDMASFVGFKTFISSFSLSGESIVVNDIVNQGYWAFHVGAPYSITESGTAPATTVPNPLDAVSPIPLGSCLVTGAFETPLTITGSETSDVVVEVQISVNNSFEWVDTNPDDKYEPANEMVVDMGTRGLKAVII